MRALGVDYGQSRVGLAISDESGRIASPIGVMSVRSSNVRDVAVQIGELARQRGVALVVLGYPKNMDGTPGVLAGDIAELARALESEGFRVQLWDERLSTAQAERVLVEADMSRQKRRKLVDKLAACLILQGYLDSQGFRGGSRSGYED